MTTLTQRDLWVVREALRRYSTAEPNMASTAQRLAERFNAELHARLDAASVPQQSEAADLVPPGGEPAELDLASVLDSVVAGQAQLNTALAEVLTALRARQGVENRIPVQG